jgi:hypothetical protein
MDGLTCDLCIKGLTERLRDVVSRWVSVQVSLGSSPRTSLDVYANLAIAHHLNSHRTPIPQPFIHDIGETEVSPQIHPLTD